MERKEREKKRGDETTRRRFMGG